MSHESLLTRRQVLAGMAATRSLPFGSLLAASASGQMRGALMILSTPYTESGDVDYESHSAISVACKESSGHKIPANNAI